jgi:hypothetical protein
MHKNITRAFRPPRDLYYVQRVTKEIVRNDEATRVEEEEEEAEEVVEKKIR